MSFDVMISVSLSLSLSLAFILTVHFLVYDVVSNGVNEFDGISIHSFFLSFLCF